MIELIAVGPGVAPDRLNRLAPVLEHIFETDCRVRAGSVNAQPARDLVRDQYRSTAILEQLHAIAPPNGTRLVGIAAVDLFVPIFTFVFGEAEVGGRCALASTYRLDEARYGLPANEAKLQERLVKEAAHELGHTFGLLHCDRWECVMASSHSVERVDVKSERFCQDCAAVIQAALAQSRPPVGSRNR